MGAGLLANLSSLTGGCPALLHYAWAVRLSPRTRYCEALMYRLLHPTVLELPFIAWSTRQMLRSYQEERQPPDFRATAPSTYVLSRLVSHSLASGGGEAAIYFFYGPIQIHVPSAFSVVFSPVSPGGSAVSFPLDCNLATTPSTIALSDSSLKPSAILIVTDFYFIRRHNLTSSVVCLAFSTLC